MAKSCFFISRIGDPDSAERAFSDKLLKFIVAPAVRSCGYDVPIRADQITQPGVITTQVFAHLWNDDLVVADLTGDNPNVFYELAVRHIRRKPFIHLIQAGHTIPFDIAPNRTIEFDFDIEKAEQAKTALEAMVKSAPSDPASLQTPLSSAVEFSATEGSSDPVREGLGQLLSSVQEITAALRGGALRTDSGFLTVYRSYSFAAMLATSLAAMIAAEYRTTEYGDLRAQPKNDGSILVTRPDRSAVIPAEMVMALHAKPFGEVKDQIRSFCLGGLDPSVFRTRPLSEGLWAESRGKRP